MNIVTMILSFFNFYGEGLMMQGSRYIVEEPRKKKTKKSTKKKKKSLKLSQKGRSNWKGLHAIAGEGLRAKKIVNC